MNRNIKQIGFNRNKTIIKNRTRTRKIISHPLSHIFTAEHYETNIQQLTMTFYECYLTNRFYYPSIEWNIRRNLLRFYTNSSKKEIKCVKISLENCNKETQIINPREAQLFIKNCKHFMHEMATNRDEIKHTSFRKFLSDKNKMVLFLGEEHIYDYKRAERYVEFLMKFFDSFKTIPGMIIDLFFETEYNKKHIYFEYERFKLYYTPLYEKLKDSPHVRLHQTDYRGSPALKPLEILSLYVLEIHNTDPFVLDISYVHGFLEMIKPLFDIKNFKINFPELLKQYQKINKVHFLRTLFFEFFTNISRQVNWLINDITSYLEGEEYDDDEYRQKYYNKIINNRIISDEQYLLNTWSRFMDIYTIGRILKPGYNYCVIHGGAFHTVDMLKTLEKHGLISSKNPSFSEMIRNSELIRYDDIA